MVRSLAVVSCLALVAGCGSSKRQTLAPHAMPERALVAASSSDVATPASVGPGDSRDEIVRLSAEIDRQREELHLPLPAPAPAGATAEPMASVPLSTDATCRPAKTDRCTQSCTFSDSICTNAGKICDLASQVPQDTWAADKCVRAKQTCEAAHESCCTCT